MSDSESDHDEEKSLAQRVETLKRALRRQPPPVTPVDRCALSLPECVFKFLTPVSLIVALLDAAVVFYLTRWVLAGILEDCKISPYVLYPHAIVNILGSFIGSGILLWTTLVKRVRKQVLAGFLISLYVPFQFMLAREETLEALIDCYSN